MAFEFVGSDGKQPFSSFTSLSSNASNISLFSSLRCNILRLLKGSSSWFYLQMETTVVYDVLNSVFEHHWKEIKVNEKFYKLERVSESMVVLSI